VDQEQLAAVVAHSDEDRWHDHRGRRGIGAVGTNPADRPQTVPVVGGFVVRGVHPADLPSPGDGPGPMTVMHGLLPGIAHNG
jgi:hypothetical protein